MGDGLNWSLNIDGLDPTAAKADKLADVLGRLDKRLSEIDKATGKVAQAHHQHAEGIGRLGRAVEGATHHFGKMVEVVAEWKIAEKIVEGFSEALGEIPRKIVEIIDVAAKMERSEKSFGLIFGENVGRENLEYIERIGKYTEFTRGQLRDAALDLAKVGFKGKDLDRAIGASLDMAAFSPDKNAGLAGALQALEMLKTRGRIEGRQLRGFGINEQDFYGTLARRTGKGVAELKKEMDKGTLDTGAQIETLYSMIAQKTGKNLGGAGVAMGKTMEATLTHLGELPERYFEKLAKSPGFDRLKDTLGEVLEELDPESPTGRRIFGALEDAFSGLGKIIGAVPWADLIEHATNAIETAEEMFLQALAIIPGETGSKASYALNNMKRARHERDVNKAEDAHFEAVAKQKGTTPAFEQAAADAEDYADLEEAEKSGALMGKATEDGFRAATRTHSPSDSFKDVGRDLMAGLSIGMSDGPAPSAKVLGGGASSTPYGPMSLHVTNTVHVDGTGLDKEEIAEEVAQRLARLVPSSLEPAFADLRGHLGI